MQIICKINVNVLFDPSRNMKMKMWLGGCSVVVLIVIILIIYFSVPHSSGSSDGSGNSTVV